MSIPTLPCCSAHSAASKYPAHPDMMLSDAIQIIRPLSFPFAPFQLDSVVDSPIRSVCFLSVCKPLCSNRSVILTIAATADLLYLSPWRSIIYRPSVALFDFLLCYGPPLQSFPAPVCCPYLTPPPTGHLYALISGSSGQVLVHNQRI